MRRSGGFTLIETLVGLTIIAVLVVGAYTVWQRPVEEVPTISATATPSMAVTKAPTSTIAPTQVAEMTTTPTPDPTAGWETYKNSTYGYLFKYPSSLFLAVSGKGDGQVILDKSVEDANRAEGLEGKVIVITVISANRVGDQLISRTLLGQPAETIEEKNITLGGITGEQVHFGAPQEFIQTAVAHNKLVYYFNLHDLNYRSEYNQILSTFQFTD